MVSRKFFRPNTIFRALLTPARSISGVFRRTMSNTAPEVVVPVSEEPIGKDEPVLKPKKEKKPAPAKEPPRPIDDVTRLRIIVGRLNKVWPHPDADKLWCEEVDCGEESGPRQIASGLREYYKTSADMEGKLVLVLANLKPRPMRGFVSNGMLLCASTEDRGVELIEPPAGAVPGERVTIGDLVGEFDEVLNAKKNPWDALCEHFHTGKDEPIAMFKDLPLMTSAGVPKAATLKDAPIR
jgi:methionine--tRNA ligase beta chain